MTFDADTGLRLSTSSDDNVDERLRLLRELGLDESPDEEFDAFATDLAKAAGAPYAMVNLVTDRQFFAGLHSPPGDPDHPEVGRVMDREHGYCPDVLKRRKALVLPDVYAAPRFASNPVVDQIGIRTYAGAPLVDERTGTALGTVCFVGTEPRPKEAGHSALELIKERRDELMQLIYRRAQRSSGG